MMFPMDSALRSAIICFFEYINYVYHISLFEIARKLQMHFVYWAMIKELRPLNPESLVAQACPKVFSDRKDNDLKRNRYIS